ncbi:MAG: GMC family oxidoreductase N-terminal domain-containing protein [Epibacterium sp.]|nr:GMC family oxidoreductase N-terminal domain-containing protein [Epibacterium sp.]NQX74448.1 GMC family oxidoreductase N-terminal domain-containing protein [Epibacterium sp.]
MKFDYVIVGGGSAGATLAARLSEDPDKTVCLLEAGGGGRDLVVRMPAGAVAMIPGRPKINNWALTTVPQAGLNGRRGYQPRGRTLGGSSAINAMLYVRGHASDYDDWAALGCHGWGWKDVLPYFKKSENNGEFTDDLHGTEGPLQVSAQQTPRLLTEAFVQAGEALQIPRRTDFNTGEHEGIGHYQVTQFHDSDKNGERCSAAAGFLFPVMDRPNLTVLTKAHVHRILFEGKRAVGVAFKKGGKRQEARVAREVILCGGAFHSPQLLQLSGIGDQADLAPLGIPVVHHAPEVGQNLQDHLDFILSYKTKDRDNFGISLSGAAKLIQEGLRWRKDGTGMLATPFAEGAAFLKTDPKRARPDIQLHFVIGIVDDHARRLHAGHGFSCHICVLRPKSTGTVRLSSADPSVAPMIDPQFLANREDLDTLIAGTRLARRIMGTAPVADYVDRELYIDREPSDKELENYIRARADTIYHPVGTCRMGEDPSAVVDSQLRVIGVEGLRVVDASIMPRLIGGNTNAPTIMIAEKAADMIRADSAGPQVVTR